MNTQIRDFVTRALVVFAGVFFGTTVGAAVVDNVGGITISHTTGDMDMASHPIHSLGDGTATADAVTLGQLTAFKTLTFEEDWLGSLAGKFQWASTATGTGAACTQVSTGQDATHIGIIQCSTGTTATGKSSLFSGAATFWVASNTTGAKRLNLLVQIPVLSVTGTQQYVAYAGCLDSATAAPGNGVYYRYDATSDLHWKACTASATVETCNNTTNTVTAGQWDNLQWDIANGTSNVTYTINGTSTGITNSTAWGACSPAVSIFSAIGTTAKTVLWDIVRYTDYFASSRG